MQVNWNDVKEDYKRKDDEIESLKQQLATAQQEATAYRISLENLEASLPKVRADAVRGAIKEYQKEYVCWSIAFILEAYADKLEAGNE